MNKIFKTGQKTSLIAASVTVSLAIIKAVIGFLSGSVVLLGDAVHSFADSFSSFAAWVGLKIAKKKPTEQFHYGFYKAESVTALIISFLILFAGYSIIKESIGNILSSPELSIPILAMGAAALDGLVMFFVGRYEVKKGRSINSQSLIADGKESRMHLLSSSVVLVGVLAAHFNIPYLEGITGIIISLFIFEAGIDTLKDSIFSLMDVSPDSETEKTIKKTLSKISGLRSFEGLKLRKSGPFVFGEVTAKIGKRLDIKKANEISENIEKNIKEKVKNLDSFTISFKPFETKKQKICIPINEQNGLDSKISDHFGRAKYFIFLNTDDGEIKDFYIKENIYSDDEVRAGLKASKFVIKEKVDLVITNQMGPISLHTLRDNIVDVYKNSNYNIKETVRLYFENNLKFLKKPTRKKT